MEPPPATLARLRGVSERYPERVREIALLARALRATSSFFPSFTSTHRTLCALLSLFLSFSVQHPLCLALSFSLFFCTTPFVPCSLSLSLFLSFCTTHVVPCPHHILPSLRFAQPPPLTFRTGYISVHGGHGVGKTSGVRRTGRPRALPFARHIPHNTVHSPHTASHTQHVTHCTSHTHASSATHHATQ